MKYYFGVSCAILAAEFAGGVTAAPQGPVGGGTGSFVWLFATTMMVLVVSGIAYTIGRKNP